MHPPTPSHPLSAGDDQPTTRTAVEAQCGAYRLSEVIGQSARSVVYLATRSGDRTTSRLPPCALKRPAGDGPGPVRLENSRTLMREIALMRRMNHVGIVRALDCQTDATGAPYMVMELLEGLPLDRLMRRLGRVGDVMPSALSAFVVHEIATALAYVHALTDESDRQLGVVHAQLRPKDVMLSRAGEVKLLAFGPGHHEPAPVSNPRPSVRTIRRHACYRAPEQIMGRHFDQRADLFALGALFWELLVGPPLFSGATEHDAVAAVLNNEVPPPSSLRQGIPARLDALVMRALARDPARRYPSAEALAGDLARGLPTRPKLTRYTATVVANQLGPARSKEVSMSSTSESRTPRPGDPRPPQASAPSAPQARSPKVPPPLPMPAGHTSAPQNRRTTLPLPGPATPAPGAATTRRPASVPPPLPPSLQPGYAPAPARLSPPMPTRPYQRTPTVIPTFALSTPTPDGLTSFVNATPTPTMRPLLPPAFPARPTHRPPLLSRTERIERIILQWVSVGAIGFVCGVLWHQRHVAAESADGGSNLDARPVIMAIDNPTSDPGQTAAAPAPRPMAEPMVIQARSPRPTAKAAPHRASSKPTATLRASARRNQAIR